MRIQNANTQEMRTLTTKLSHFCIFFLLGSRQESVNLSHGRHGPWFTHPADLWRTRTAQCMYVCASCSSGAQQMTREKPPARQLGWVITTYLDFRRPTRPWPYRTCRVFRSTPCRSQRVRQQSWAFYRKSEQIWLHNCKVAVDEIGDWVSISWKKNHLQKNLFSSGSNYANLLYFNLQQISKRNMLNYSGKTEKDH